MSNTCLELTWLQDLKVNLKEPSSLYCDNQFFVLQLIQFFTKALNTLRLIATNYKQDMLSQLMSLQDYGL